MSRRACGLGVIAGCCMLAGVVTTRASAQEDPRTAVKFAQALRERGYFDLAAEFLESIRDQKSMPPELRSMVDYELGRISVDEASRTGDLVRRQELLDQARKKLDAFVTANPNHPRASEAMVQLARLLVERGHIAVLNALDFDPVKEKNERDAKFAEARGSFARARESYEKAVARLKTDYAKFPAFLPDDDPRKQQRDEVHSALMDAELQKAIVDYEDGQTHPAGSKERLESLSRGVTQFEGLFKSYRTQFAGLAARMWQAKCLEEKGGEDNLGAAMGIYKELMDHRDPRVRSLQRHVQYFMILVMEKRKQFALAADECTRWMSSYNSIDAQRSTEGLGVQLELAKSILAQLPEISEKEKPIAIDRATDRLKNVVRFASPHKAEALALLRQYKPTAALNANKVANLSYEDAMTQAEQAYSSREWENAITLYRAAIRRVDPAKDPDKANLARYTLAVCYYMSKHFYKASVVAEQIARRYPKNGLAPKAAELAIGSFVEAYNAYRETDRASDLRHVVDLAEFTAATWPDTEQADAARITLGQIYDGFGNHEKAIAAYESVRSGSNRWVEARTKVGSSHWELSQALRRKGTPEANKAADAELSKAVDRLKEALKSRQDAGAGPSDAALVNNACDLADVYLETSRAADGLALLTPFATGIANLKNRPDALAKPYARVLADLLRAHIATNQVDQALADMGVLEKSGPGGAGLTQLYFGLGKLLEREMESLQKKGDSAGLRRTQSAYQKFLTALVASKTGQTYESLMWAGENMLKLDNGKEAGVVFQRVLDDLAKDKEPADPARHAQRVLRARLRLVSALRGQGDFTRAESELGEIASANPRMLEPLVEKALLAEARAEARQGTWAASFQQWRDLAGRLERARPKPVEYYDAWWHCAYALQKQNQTAKARQTLSAIMRLSPTLGSPEMKTKYQDLLKKLK